MAKYSSRRICRDSEWQNRIVSVRVSIASNRVIARTRWGCFGGMCFLPQGSRSADRWSERSVEAGEPTGAREQVCGPDVILTTGVKGAREISAGRSPLAKQVARAVRARQNHVGGVPANCELVSPEAKPSREAYPPTEGRCRRQSLEWWRYAGCEQVGRRPRHRAAWRRKKPPHNST